ncbi:peroxisomal biogenesis factor 19 [Diachasma alloeum]|uniref:peroxisomal biogenesis factor 19 n=1 Tax=Diachasma alloeum TaxID=454923 RepID=UPI0007381782|nr:peroxisomal biogenesis factor 19 [Diachasma alloeum]
MSEEKKSGDQANDAELDDLLNSALEDFNKLPQLVKKEDAPAAATGPSDQDSPEELVDETWSQDFIRQTADQFEKNLQSLLEKGGDSDISGSLQQMAQTVANAISSNGPADAEGNEFQAAIAQALKDISATSETLQNAGPGITEADLAAMFGQTSLEEPGGDILPFMQGMMQSLLSKEILYPSLKELVDKYPAWLDEKKESLSQEDLARFTKQFDLMQKVCTELEKEKDDDSDPVKKQQFEKILGLMQEMQNCGQPPEDLVGEQTSLFQFDNDGNPMIGQSLPPGVDPQNCSIM